MDIIKKMEVYLNKTFTKEELEKIAISGSLKDPLYFKIVKWELDIPEPDIEVIKSLNIPDDGKVYKYENGEIVEDLDALLSKEKQNVLEIISEKKKTPFVITITDINNDENSYYIDLEDSSILKLLVLLKKAEITGQASDEFINSETEKSEYKTFSIQAIEQVQSIVIEKDDFLKLKTSQVKNSKTFEELADIREELTQV